MYLAIFRRFGLLRKVYTIPKEKLMRKALVASTPQKLSFYTIIL